MNFMVVSPLVFLRQNEQLGNRYAKPRAFILLFATVHQEMM